MYKNLITQEGFQYIKTNYLYTAQEFLQPFGIIASKLSSHSRRSVFQEAGRYCEWEKIKNRYRVICIYPEPKPPERKRRSDSFYPEHLEKLLPPRTSIMTKKQLWEYVGMINSRYIPQYKKHEPAYEQFFDETYKYFSHILTDALNALKINYSTEYIIAYNDHTRLAEDKDLDYIIDIQERVLKELDCSNINEVFYRHLDQKYFARCNQIYKVTFLCKYVYEVIKIEVPRSNRYSGRKRARQELNRRCYEWAARIDPVLAKKYIKLIDKR